MTRFTKITTLFLALSMGMLPSAFAQKKTVPYYPKGFRIGFGLHGGISTNSDYDAVFGADARLQYDLSKETSFTLTSGYTHLKEKHDQDIWIGLLAGLTTAAILLYARFHQISNRLINTNLK